MNTLIDIILICIGGGTITWAFMWSRKERQRKANEQFRRQLKGVRFDTWDELRTWYRDRGVTIQLDGPFDLNRFGNMEDTLLTIDKSPERQAKELNIDLLLSPVLRSIMVKKQAMIGEYVICKK